ncbi:MAG: PIN domain-containing protein [Candidatus Acidiferrales bacterium]
MKALDTPVLLAVLHDSPMAKDLLKSLRGEEIATTELNMFELRALASEVPRAARQGRDSALVRLRRRISVLPVSPEAVHEAGRYLHLKGASASYQSLVWGTLSAAGCGEWITTRGFAPPKGGLPFRIRLV